MTEIITSYDRHMRLTINGNELDCLKI